jgi:hypothetical protein
MSKFLLLAPFYMQETTCRLPANVVYGLQLVTVHMMGNETPDDDRHAVCIMKLKRREE